MGEEDPTPEGTGRGETADRVGAVRACSAPHGERETGNAARVLKKSLDLVRERPAVIFAGIADWADSGEYGVVFMCAQLGVHGRLLRLAGPGTVGAGDGGCGVDGRDHRGALVVARQSRGAADVGASDCGRSSRLGEAGAPADAGRGPAGTALQAVEGHHRRR